MYIPLQRYVHLLNYLFFVLLEIFASYAESVGQ